MRLLVRCSVWLCFLLPNAAIAQVKIQVPEQHYRLREELKPKWTVDLKHHGLHPSRKGYLGAPDSPGSIDSVACGQSLVAVTVNANVLFFSVDTGDLVGMNTLPGPGFAWIYAINGNKFLVYFSETFSGGGHKLLLLDEHGSVVNSFDLLSDKDPSRWTATVSTEGKSFLLSRFLTGAMQYQLRDSETFAVRQSWVAPKGSPIWRWLSDTMLLSIQNYPLPLGHGNRASNEQPILAARPGGDAYRLGQVLAGEASIVPGRHILAFHVNKLSIDLVDDSGRVLRTYDVPFSGGHLYFRPAAVAADGHYFAAHFLGQKNPFVPGRDYLYVWNIDNVEPIAFAQIRWDQFYESESAFCSTPSAWKIATVSNGKLELFTMQ